MYWNRNGRYLEIVIASETYEWSFTDAEGGVFEDAKDIPADMPPPPQLLARIALSTRPVVDLLTSKGMTVNIALAELVGAPHAVSSADGSAVHDRIAEALRHDEPVVLSFAGMEDVTSAFLNAAVGQLYGEFNEDVIRERLRVTDAEGDQLLLLKGVVDRAKEFFREPEHYTAALSGALNE